MIYAHLLHAVARAIWAVDEDQLQALLALLASRRTLLSAEELRARFGDPEASSSTQGAVAVIPLRGIITHRMGGWDDYFGASAERFGRMVKAAAADPNVTAILLDCDSIGGTVNGVAEAAQAVFDARQQKKVIAIANAWMASACYWIASQATEVVAIPSAFDRCIGSIGVMLVHQDLSENLAKEGIKITLIRAGENKNRVNPFEPLSDEALAELKASAEAAKARFVKDVARGRGITAAQVVERYGDGLAFSSADAKAAGLVDRIATYDDTLAKLTGRASKTAGMRAEEADTTESSDAIPRMEPLLAAERGEELLDEDRRRRLERF